MRPNVLTEFNTKPYWVNRDYVHAVFEKSRSKGNARLVLLALARHANGTGVCWPSLATLSRHVNADRRTVQRAIEQLKELGEIDVLPGAGPNGQNVYRIRLLVPATESTGGNLPTGSGNLARGGGSFATEGETTKAVGDGLTPSSEPTPNKQRKRKKENPSPLPPPQEALTDEAPEVEEEDFEKSEKIQRLKAALGDGFDDLEALLRQGLASRRWTYWLEHRLYPVLERMGEERFSAAARFVLPEAAGPGVKYPAKLFLKKLLEVERGELVVVAPPPPASEHPADGGEGTGEEAEDKGGLPPELRAFILRMATRAALEHGPLPPPDPERRCPHGDHPRSDVCCPPRARETLEWAIPFLKRAMRAGRQDEEVLDVAQLAVAALAIAEDDQR